MVSRTFGPWDATVSLLVFCRLLYCVSANTVGSSSNNGAFVSRLIPSLGNDSEASFVGILPASKAELQSVNVNLLAKIAQLEARLNDVQGTTGSSGAQGKDGSNGVNGRDGSTGPSGPSGPGGATGQMGFKGEIGDTGSTGARGDTGFKGDTGEMGLKGDTGSTGARGDTGFNGDTGEMGLKGDTGSTGARGDTGFKGDTGEMGLKGDTGSTGARGDTGFKGDTGEMGLKGDTGDIGPTGPTGLATCSAFFGSCVAPTTPPSCARSNSPDCINADDTCAITATPCSSTSTGAVNPGTCSTSNPGQCAVPVDYALALNINYQPQSDPATFPGVFSTAACGAICSSLGSACVSFLFISSTQNCLTYGPPPPNAPPAFLGGLSTDTNSAIQTVNGFVIIQQAAFTAVISRAGPNTLQGCFADCLNDPTFTCDFAVFRSDFAGGTCFRYNSAITGASINPAATTFYRANTQYPPP